MLSVLEKVLFLREVPLLEDARTEALAHLASAACETRLDEGDYLWPEREHLPSIYFIIEGEVRLSSNGTARVIGSRQDIGLSLLLSRNEVNTSARAITPVWLLKIGREDFWEAVNEHPELGRTLLVAIGRRLGTRLVDVEPGESG